MALPERDHYCIRVAYDSGVNLGNSGGKVACIDFATKDRIGIDDAALGLVLRDRRLRRQPAEDEEPEEPGLDARP